VRLRLDELDEALRRSRAACGLVEVLEALGGPIADRKALRRSAAEAREAMWARAARHPAVTARPALGKWLEEIRRIGLVRRLAARSGIEEARLLEEALEVVSHLPAQGTPLSVLAAVATGDAHALDRGRPLAALVLRAVACETGRPEPPSSALERRLLWEEAGVVCDPVSPNVLVLGLRPSGEAWPARHLRDAAGAGEPVRLTLRQLARFPLAFDRAEPVYVCENPAVAADRLGAACPALVCTEGVPSTAAFRLLEAVRSAGCALRFHGDFDWGGLRIMNEIYARFGGEPWRFDAAHYREALARGLGTGELGPRAVEALWDKDLGRAGSTPPPGTSGPGTAPRRYPRSFTPCGTHPGTR
jgi:uncharacterized protein (TIGR02679 family)